MSCILYGCLSLLVIMSLCVKYLQYCVLWNSDEAVWTRSWPAWGSTLRIFHKVKLTFISLDENWWNMSENKFVQRAMCKPDSPENLLTCCRHVGAKDELADHDWSLYLRSITRVCMERLNSVEILGRYSQSNATLICFVFSLQQISRFVKIFWF